MIPRPETEELVSRIIDDLYAEDDEWLASALHQALAQPIISGQTVDDEADDGPFSILDLCTGSGCIAWSLSAEFPEAMVYGCDLSETALRFACRQRVKVRGAKPIFFSSFSGH